MTKEQYEKELRLVGWDEDCIFSALHGFSMGYEQGLREAKKQDQALNKSKIFESKDWYGFD